MKKRSIWQDVRQKNYKELEENKEVDVLIIGGGLTGISTLFHLRDSNLKVILVEQNKIGMSTTSRSTGKLNYLQNDILDKIRTSFNDEIASKYLKSQQHAIRKIVDTIKKEKIDCDLEKTKATLYTAKEKEVEKLKELQRFLKENGIKTETCENSLVKSKYLIEGKDTYTYHPLKFIYGLLEKNSYPIYENTSIKKIEKKDTYYICKTKNYEIKTKWVCIASHYPYFLLPGLFPLRVSVEKSYISASQKKINPLSLISYSNPFISMRNYKEYLIYLSDSHLVNKKVEDKKHFKSLQKNLKNLNLKAEYVWSNSDMMTSDSLPIIGELKEHLLIATGYNTWGLSNGFLAGEILTSIIQKKENFYRELFTPKRMNLTGVVGGIKNLYHSIEGFLAGYMIKNKEIIYDKLDNKDIMIYKEHSVYRTCPHMGCKLLWNETEKTWDCPCHGSRFERDGTCIISPSNKDIKVRR